MLHVHPQIYQSWLRFKIMFLQLWLILVKEIMQGKFVSLQITCISASQGGRLEPEFLTLGKASCATGTDVSPDVKAGIDTIPLINKPGLRPHVQHKLYIFVHQQKYLYPQRYGSFTDDIDLKRFRVNYNKPKRNKFFKVWPTFYL